jgi:hypothetical protein
MRHALSNNSCISFNVQTKREEEYDYAPSGFCLLFRHYPTQYDSSLWPKLDNSEYQYSHAGFNYNYAIARIYCQYSHATGNRGNDDTGDEYTYGH